MRYDVKYTDRTDKSGGGTAAHTGLPPYTFFSKDWTVGLRWDVTPQFMLRAEYHSVEGTSWLSNRENTMRETK